MASNFPQALGQQVSPSAYEQLMAELASKPQTQPNMFTPDQVKQRISQNNALTELGVVGQMGGSADTRQVGGSVFKKALADRQERVTNRGVQDPLTGETSVDPEYAREADEGRRGRVLQQAVAYEDKRQRERERQEDRQRQHEYRTDEIRTRGQFRAGVDAEMTGLKKDLIRAQIDGTNSRIDQAEAKANDKITKAQGAADAASSRASEMVKHIDGILQRTEPLNTGLIGSVLGKVPGTGAYDLRKDIDTIKANIGFNELADMRKHSPTGGALGQVAVKELDMLQATIANLDASQSEDQLRVNLQKVKKHYSNWANTVAQAVPAPQDRSVQPAPGIQAPPGGAPQSPAAPAARPDPLGLRRPAS